MSAVPLKPNLVNFAKDTLLFKEGDPGGDVIIIQSGRVEVFQKRNGQEWVLSTLEKGELLGVMTALTAEPRTASARALTDVTGILVKKDQIAATLKAFPAWGNTMIKDLISRVKSGNEIFIEKAMEAEGRPVDDPLTLAIMVSSSLTPILKMMTAGGETVTFKALCARVADVLGIEEPAVEATLEIFNQEKLLESTGKDANDRSFQIASVRHIKPLADFVRGIKRLASEPETASTILAVGEREVLLQIAEVALQSTSKPDDVAEFAKTPFAALLRKYGDETAVQIMLRRAEHLGYLKIEKQGDNFSLKFSPAVLAMTMRFYNLIRRLNPRAFAMSAVKKAMMF